MRPVRDYDSALQADSEAYGRFFRGMLARGVYPPPSQFEAWFISAAHTERDIARTIAAAEGAMREVRQGLTASPYLAALRNVNGRESGPCVNVPAISEPSAFNAPTNEALVIFTSHATAPSFSVTSAGSSSAP